MKRILLSAALFAAVLVVATPFLLVYLPQLRPAQLPLSLRIHEFAMVVPGVTMFMRWEAETDASREFALGKRLLFGYNHGSDVGLEPPCTEIQYRRDHAREADLPTWSKARVQGMMTLQCPDFGAKLDYSVLELGNYLRNNEWVYFKTYNETMLRLAEHLQNT